MRRGWKNINRNLLQMTMCCNVMIQSMYSRSGPYNYRKTPECKVYRKNLLISLVLYNSKEHARVLSGKQFFDKLCLRMFSEFYGPLLSIYLKNRQNERTAKRSTIYLTRKVFMHKLKSDQWNELPIISAHSHK